MIHTIALVAFIGLLVCGALIYAAAHTVYGRLWRQARDEHEDNSI